MQKSPLHIDNGWLNLVHWTNHDHLAHLESFAWDHLPHHTEFDFLAFYFYTNIKCQSSFSCGTASILPLVLTLQGQWLIFSHHVSRAFAKLLSFNRCAEKMGVQKEVQIGVQKGVHILCRPFASHLSSSFKTSYCRNPMIRNYPCTYLTSLFHSKNKSFFTVKNWAPWSCLVGEPMKCPHLPSHGSN